MTEFENSAEGVKTGDSGDKMQNFLASARADVYSKPASSALTSASAKFSSSYGDALAREHGQFNQVFKAFVDRKDLGVSEKLQIIGKLSDIASGNGLQKSGITEKTSRHKLVAAIIDNLGDPHGIDQGSFPTCTTAAKEEQHYSGQGGDNPGAVVYIVDALKEIALNGQLTEPEREFGSRGVTKLSKNELRPDWESRRDQGSNDYRNFASQLYHTAARKDYSVRHSVLENQFPDIKDHDSSPERKAADIAATLENQSAVTISLSPDSKFNQIMAGSEPYFKGVGHAVTLYRQKDEFAKPEYKDGQALYFVSDQRGRELDRHNLTISDLENIYRTYDRPLEQLIGEKSKALPGEEERHNYYFARLKDLSRRQRIMLELGEWKIKY